MHLDIRVRICVCVYVQQATADVKCQLKGQRGAKEKTDKRTNSGIHTVLLPKRRKRVKRDRREEKKKNQKQLEALVGER